MTPKALYSGYCIDTCALIDLWRRHYPPDVFETLWRDLEDLISQGTLTAPKEVFEEIKNQDDDFLKWAKKNKEIFEDLDQEQLAEVKVIERDFPNFVDWNKTAPEADPFIIALAKVKGWTVVTSEKQGTQDRPRIPDVCRKYDIKCISLVEFFREKGWKY